MMGRRSRKQKQESIEDNQQQSDGSTSKDDVPRRTKKSNLNKTGKSVSTNPFLIFFLRMRSKKPNEPVTVIARTAGRIWSKMTPEERKKYVNLANDAKKKRGNRKRKKRDTEVE